MKKRRTYTLYKKCGNKFIPVGKDDNMVPHVEGDYLVRVRRHSTKMTSRTIPLTVDWARVEVALDEAADAVAMAMREASKQEPTQRPNTLLERKAWDAYVKVLKVDRLMLTRKSACDIAQASVKCLRELLKGKSQCPKGCLEVYAERMWVKV